MPPWRRLCCRHVCQFGKDNLLFQSQSIATCLELQEPPTNCGQLGGICCPHGLYRANNSDGFIRPEQPFCWDSDVCEYAAGSQQRVRPSPAALILLRAVSVSTVPADCSANKTLLIEAESDLGVNELLRPTSKCLRIPKLKVDCGGPGQPCCPRTSVIYSDKLEDLPRICQVGGPICSGTMFAACALPRKAASS